MFYSTVSTSNFLCCKLICETPHWCNKSLLGNCNIMMQGYQPGSKFGTWSKMGPKCQNGPKKSRLCLQVPNFLLPDNAPEGMSVAGREIGDHFVGNIYVLGSANWRGPFCQNSVRGKGESNSGGGKEKLADFRSRASPCSVGGPQAIYLAKVWILGPKLLPLTDTASSKGVSK